MNSSISSTSPSNALTVASGVGRRRGRERVEQAISECAARPANGRQVVRDPRIEPAQHGGNRDQDGQRPGHGEVSASGDLGDEQGADDAQRHRAREWAEGEATTTTDAQDAKGGARLDPAAAAPRSRRSRRWTRWLMEWATALRRSGASMRARSHPTPTAAPPSVAGRRRPGGRSARAATRTRPIGPVRAR